MEHIFVLYQIQDTDTLHRKKPCLPIAYKNSNLLIPDGQSMGTYRFCNENVHFKIFDKNKYYNAEPAQYILSIGFRPEDTTSEQMLNCIRNLIDIGIIAKDDASS